MLEDAGSGRNDSSTPYKYLPLLWIIAKHALIPVVSHESTTISSLFSTRLETPIAEQHIPYLELSAPIHSVREMDARSNYLFSA